jgi:hypothetical protein
MRNGHYDLRKVVSDTMYCTRQAPNSIFASQFANPDEILFGFVQLSDGSLKRTTISPSATWSIVIHQAKRDINRTFLRSFVKTNQGVHIRGGR